MKFVFLIRMCPVVPFMTFNLAFSLTNISYKDFALGQFGMIPGLLLRVFIGTTLSSLTQDTSGIKKNPLVLAVVIGGTIVAIGGIVYITKVTKRHLNELNFNEEQAEIELEAPTLPKNPQDLEKK